jgi:uncharacterized protein (DUF849 family)
MDAEKLIINAALTGCVATRAQSPRLPLIPAEIAADGQEVVRLGATMLHLHAREKDGSPSWKKEIYREIIGRVREQCGDVVIVVSTTGRHGETPEQRGDVLRLRGDVKPDMASLTLGSVDFKRDSSVNPPEVIRRLLDTMIQAGIKPEAEIFDAGMARFARRLADKGLLEGPRYANLILGASGILPSAPHPLVPLVEELPENTLWAASGIGKFASGVHDLVLAMGGYLRIGLEDCLHLTRDGKKRPATNGELVARAVEAARALGRRPASIGETSRALGLARGPSAG